MKRVEGAHIEIVDRGGDGPALVPNEVRINGTPVLVPAGAPVKIHEITDEEIVRVTLTVFARHVEIKPEPSEETRAS